MPYWIQNWNSWAILVSYFLVIPEQNEIHIKMELKFDTIILTAFISISTIGYGWTAISILISLNDIKWQNFVFRILWFPQVNCSTTWSWLIQNPGIELWQLDKFESPIQTNRNQCNTLNNLDFTLGFLFKL